MDTVSKQSLEDLQKAGRTLIDTREAASVLAVKPQTLYKWACYENGPIKSIKVGRSIKWRLTDIANLVG